MLLRVLATVSALALAAGAAPGGVVINEIFYHAPDDLDDLQYVELHNPDAQPADLAGWKLAKGVKYTFPAGTTIPGDGYLVVCKNKADFQKHYGAETAHAYSGRLAHSGDRVELRDAAGKLVDVVEYGSRGPWPRSPDGYGPSLERICPTAPADAPENWAPSPLGTGTPRPGGTPGKKNATFAPRLPPVVVNVTVSPPHAAPGQDIRIEADVRSPDGVGKVEVRYRVAGPGAETEEAIPVTAGTRGRYTATVPGQKAGQIVRVRVRAVDGKGTERSFPHENELRPALSVYVHDAFEEAKVPLGFVINVGQGELRGAEREQPGGFRFGAGPGAASPARGRSAFVYVDPKTREPELFDFVTVTPRSAGRKVHFHKDRPLGDMTTINLIYEFMDRFVLAEPLAYEVYRKAGNAACRTEFVRTWVDGRPIGFQLLIEQPNKAFLRHNKVNPDGNLYKCVWFGNGVVGQHEKHTHTHAGPDDLVKVVADLNKTKGDEQWAVIKKEFDVEQVINYFAVNMLLSHWDGYFNNYFAYHSPGTKGKWTMYPWDQDKTWGFHDGIQGNEVFTDMPVTFGMAGDRPPGWPKDRPAPQNFFAGGSIWWRPPGHFSGPLLANPRFRKLFLARTKELLETVYTKDVMFPVIQETGDRLVDEVKVRAALYRQDPKDAVAQLNRNLDSLREHLTKRRAFLLGQDEIKTAGKFDRNELK
jgi:CotH kinase protein/Lamin Tail Domain